MSGRSDLSSNVAMAASRTRNATRSIQPRGSRLPIGTSVAATHPQRSSRPAIARHQARVHSIALFATIRQVVALDLEHRPQAQRRQHAVEGRDVQRARIRALDPPDLRLGRTDAVGQLALRPADR